MVVNRRAPQVASESAVSDAVRLESSEVDSGSARLELLALPGLGARQGNARLVQFLLPLTALVDLPAPQGQLERLELTEPRQGQRLRSQIREGLNRLERQPLEQVLATLSPLVLRGQEPQLRFESLQPGPVSVGRLVGEVEALSLISGLETLAILRKALKLSLAVPEDAVPVTVRLETMDSRGLDRLELPPLPPRGSAHQQLCDRAIACNALLSRPKLLQNEGTRLRDSGGSPALFTRATIASVIAELLCGGVSSQRRQRFYSHDCSTPEAQERHLTTVQEFFTQLQDLNPHWRRIAETGVWEGVRLDLTFTPSLLRVLAAACYRLGRDRQLSEPERRAAIAWVLGQTYDADTALLRETGLARSVGDLLRLSTQQDDIVRTANALATQARNQLA